MAVDVPFVKYNHKEKGNGSKAMNDIAEQWNKDREERGSVLERLRVNLSDFNKVDVND